jgi:hypothetical protein
METFGNSKCCVCGNYLLCGAKSPETQGCFTMELLRGGRLCGHPDTARIERR